jgi:transcriptional regulator with XRE-family HTH domain
MKKASYREQDYAFGQLMLTLRTAIGLTQAGLAEFLGVSRHAVGGWEAGESYPKAEHLKHIIALGLQQHAFAAGHEGEEIRALWRAAHQKVLLDERWLQGLLSQQTRRTDTVSAAPTGGEPRLDWGDALDVPTFYGREGGAGAAVPLGGRGALSGGECAGHGRHRQVGAGRHLDAPTGGAVRGGDLAVPARCPRM